MFGYIHTYIQKYIHTYRNTYIQKVSFYNIEDRIWVSRSNPGFDLSEWNELLRVFLSRSG